MNIIMMHIELEPLSYLFTKKRNDVLFSFTKYDMASTEIDILHKCNMKRSLTK